MNGQQNQQQQQIQIKASDDDLKGRYSNTMFVAHTKEEFILDFLLISQPNGELTSRVITSPGHVKRIYKALGENIKLYEDKFGKIQEAQGPESNIGFKPQK